MHSLRKKYLDSLLNYNLIIVLATVLLFALPLKTRAQTVINYSGNQLEESEDIFNFSDDLLILEPVIQGFNLSDYAYVSQTDGKEYIALSQMSQYLGIKYIKNPNNTAKLWYADNEDVVYFIDFVNRKVILTDKKGYIKEDKFWFRDYDVDVIDETIFFSVGFWRTLLEADIEIDELNMQLVIKREKDFPTIAKMRAEKKRDKTGFHEFSKDSISDYDFDDRLIAEPVLDVQLGKGWGMQKGGRTYNTDTYAVNLAMIAGGLDVNTYVSGNSSNDRKPTVRISGSRTFLDEPKNKFNLKTLKIGDISGISQSYFVNAGYGRGVALSSFKNLVMSADKTIDLTGPLTPGWEVELYWNEQLIGFRQSGINGEYNFNDVPVSYGLNTFKLVFYGPYGETRTEYERYYSGTSPVKTGEFGYNISAYQPYRYLVEDNRTFEYEGSDTPIIDMTGYYGATDDLTLMGGFTQTPSAEDSYETQYFGMAGAQMSMSGSSIQYNLEQNLDTAKLGHHLEWQGDVYIGNIYAGYDKYNRIHSPNSLYSDEYLDEQYEARLSGILPWNVPYYLSYRTGKLESGDVTFENVTARLSKRLMSGLNLTLEDSYYGYGSGRGYSNVVRTGLYKWWKLFSTEAWATYRTDPDPELTEIQARIDWRAGRNTYVTGRWTRNMLNDMDYFSVSGGHVFDFGGLTATLESDRDLNLSTYLNYNISFAREPESFGIVTNANSKLSSSGTMFVKVIDEEGNPVPEVGLNANGLDKQVYTDEKGTAILADLQTYERTILRVDMESLIDISLQPEEEIKKVVLRPGTIRTVDLKFIHKGAVEGKIANPEGKRLFGYQISAIDKDEKEIAQTFADLDGYFILDGVPYGTYNIVISKEGSILTELVDVKVDDVSVYLEEDIVVDTDAINFFENIDTENETNRFVEEHEKGYNNNEYLNNTFPIDVEKAVKEPEEHQPIITIEEIEKDIFVNPNAEVFNSVASQQSYDRFIAVEKTKYDDVPMDNIERELFGLSDEDAEVIDTIQNELDDNIALKELMDTVDSIE
ncbi:MAG: carboxypeptidase regulatory-like domain-containing protein [Alphaproteobacteria bacterium]|nr:carboxypeptidase regulatory-like domain-containing protein [Alphaproteobacteria bacterium]